MFESILYQPPQPIDLHFIPSPTPTRLSSLRPPPLENPQIANHIRLTMLNKFLSYIYALHSTITHPWKQLYYFTRPPNSPQFHPLFQGFFIITRMLHSLRRYYMPWPDLSSLCHTIRMPLTCIAEEMVEEFSCSSSFPSSLMWESLFLTLLLLILSSQFLTLR